MVIASRVAGPEVFGLYASAMALATLLLYLTDLGSATVVVREGVSTGRVSEVARTYVHVRALLVAGSSVVGAALVFVALPSSAVQPGLLALLLIPFSGAVFVFPLGQLHGSMGVFRRSSAIQSVAILVAICLLAAFVENPTATQLVAANVVAAMLATFTALFGARRWITDISNVDGPAVRAMLRSISLFGIGAVLSAAYARIDGLLLLNLNGATDAGIYAASYRFLEASSMVPAALLVPTAPLIVAQLRDYGRVTSLVDRAFRRLEWSAGIGLMLILVGTAPWAIEVLLGTDFSESGKILTVLAMYRAWSILAFLSAAKVMHARRERIYVAIAAMGLTMNVGLNLILIPRYGPAGAAAATIATEFATTAAYVVASRDLSSVGRGLTLVALGGVGIAAGSLALLADSTFPPGLAAAVFASLVSAGLIACFRAAVVLRREIDTGRGAILPNAT